MVKWVGVIWKLLEKINSKVGLFLFRSENYSCFPSGLRNEQKTTVAFCRGCKWSENYSCFPSGLQTEQKTTVAFCQSWELQSGLVRKYSSFWVRESQTVSYIINIKI